MGKNPKAVPPRQILLESYLKTNKVSLDFAVEAIGRLTDERVEEELAIRRKLGLIK